MDISLLSDKYYVRRLGMDDVEIIYNLCCENHIFYRYHLPFVTRQSIAEDMLALPPGKSFEDKYYIGFFDDNNLVAVMDLITDYPREKVALIGFFMTDVKYQGRGIGSDIIQHIISGLKKLGYKKIRIGVDRENPQSNSFWKKNNFEVIKDDDYIVMELPL